MARLLLECLFAGCEWRLRDITLQCGRGWGPAAWVEVLQLSAGEKLHLLPNFRIVERMAKVKNYFRAMPLKAALGLAFRCQPNSCLLIYFFQTTTPASPNAPPSFLGCVPIESLKSESYPGERSTQIADRGIAGRLAKPRPPRGREVGGLPAGALAEGTPLTPYFTDNKRLDVLP